MRFSYLSRADLVRLEAQSGRRQLRPGRSTCGRRLPEIGDKQVLSSAFLIFQDARIGDARALKYVARRLARAQRTSMSTVFDWRALANHRVAAGAALRIARDI